MANGPWADSYEPAMSFKQIAEVLGRSTSDVRRAYDSGMRKLKDNPMLLDVAEALSFRDGRHVFHRPRHIRMAPFALPDWEPE